MIIRQAAFDGPEVKMLKGGLHCHTTRSDGALSPEDTIRLHAENGYDFLALTDHRYYNYQNFAPDANVLIIPGMEMDANILSSDGMCFHTVAIGPAADKNGYKQDDRFPSNPVENQFAFQPIVDEILSKGNLAIYCHPQWSCTPARSFDQLKGFTAMEIWNSGCVLEDNLDTDNGPIWDELLRAGQHIYAVATDDGHAKYQHCKGWVRVRAEKNIDSILEALKNGAFYASTGPEIYDFYMEDKVAHIKCSPVAAIKFHTGSYPTRVIRNADGLITEASLEIWQRAEFVRATVTDAEGRVAWTNPFFR